MTIAGIERIESVTRTVTDLGIAERFYRAAMDFITVGHAEEATGAEMALLGIHDGRMFRQEMRLGEQRITLLRFDPPGEAYPTSSTSTDLWFQHCAVVVSDMAQAYDRVMVAGARPITDGGPQHLPANTGGVSAFKFRDPFGHPLELLYFPEGTGDTIWHVPGGALFRGIDHTAISVSSRPESARFYTTVLGLDVNAQSHNRGPAQTRLDAVTDDDVDVEALAARTTPPHVELLAYRTGTRRRLKPARAQDAAVSRTIACGDIDAVADRLVRNGDPAPQRGHWNGMQAIAFTDRDGHGWICRAGA